MNYKIPNGAICMVATYAWILKQVQDDNVGQRDDNVGQRDDNVGQRDDNVGQRDDNVGQRDDNVGQWGGGVDTGKAVLAVG